MNPILDAVETAGGRIGDAQDVHRKGCRLRGHVC